MSIDPSTIFALASMPGRAGVAVTRVSGPGALCALRRLSQLDDIPTARQLTLVRLRDPVTGEDIDDALVVAFPAPDSFTGEDVCEFHTHGGRAVVAGLIEALSVLPGLRPADSGEFSRRAFENGKMDLTAAEAIADLVAAETSAQQRQALRQLDGELGRRYDDWRQRLLAAMAHMEATIDFSDEDIPEGLVEGVNDAVSGVRGEIAEHLDDGYRGQKLRDGFQIAILGPPNVGKSSLLNRLSQRDVAIVSETAGTTRDVIEVSLDLGGYPVTLADTAGIRESLSAVEREGVRRARNQASTADLKVVVLDAGSWPVIPGSLLNMIDEQTLLVVNKCDVKVPDPEQGPYDQTLIAVSALTGEGLDTLERELSRIAGERLDDGGGAPLTQVRHRQALEECLACLERSAVAGSVELKAEDLRLAARALGRITGRVDVEDILDLVFREFCIGK